MTVGSAPPSERGPTPRSRAVLAQAAMEFRLLLRSPESLLLTFGVPLGFLLFFGRVDVLPTGEERAADFLVPGVVAISVAATGLVAVAIQTGFERRYGVLKLLGGSPLSRAGYLLAKGVAVAGLLLVQLLLVVGLAVLALDWRPGGGAALAAVLVAVGAVTFTALGLLMAGTLRAEATLAGANALFLVLLGTSGVAFEAARLPAAVAAIGAVLPLGALGEALRVALAGDGLAVGPAVLVAGWGLLAIAVAARTFRWEP